MIPTRRLEFRYIKNKHTVKLLVYDTRIRDDEGVAIYRQTSHIYTVWNAKYNYPKLYPSKSHALADAKLIYREAEKYDFNKPICELVDIPGVALKFCTNVISK